MTYKLTLTWRVASDRHDKEETVVETLSDIGRVISEGGPSIWDVAYVVIQPTTTQPMSDRQPAQLAEKEVA